MLEFINFYLMPGVVLGCIYALGAIGISLTFGILRFSNFAHGEMMTFGVYVTLSMVLLTGWHPLLVAPVAMVATCALALGVDRGFYKPFRNSPTIMLVIASFGMMLMIRSAQLGVKPSKNLVGNRYRMTDHCDLLEVFTFLGAVRDRYSLDYWCRRFDVESPKGSIDGSQVGRAYRDGRIEDIGEYCLRDVRATAQLYTKLETTLLPHFKGGPR